VPPAIAPAGREHVVGVDAPSGGTRVLVLSYAQQRWYDPRIGRFLSEDPVFGDLQRPNSLQAFGYANGNPLSFTDPSGELGVKPINEADSTRQMDYWWDSYHNAPEGSAQRADALQKYQFWKSEAQDARENAIFAEEVGVPLTIDAAAAAVVGPFAKAYRAVRWGLGALSAARGAARLKKASEEKGTQRTADLIGGTGELVGGGLMFTPELVKAPGAIKQKLSGLSRERTAKTAPADLVPAPRSLGAAAREPAQTREEIQGIVEEVLRPAAEDIRSKVPGAQVGYRGSLATGMKGPHKVGPRGERLPFDPQDFDVDAFIVSDELAAKIPSAPGGFRSMRTLPGARSMQSRIQTELEESLPGLRADEEFTFRVWTQQEFETKVRPNGFVIIGTEK
jgi:RHS repeat-associated protein